METVLVDYQRPQRKNENRRTSWPHCAAGAESPCRAYRQRRGNAHRRFSRPPSYYPTGRARNCTGVPSRFDRKHYERRCRFGSRLHQPHPSTPTPGSALALSPVVSGLCQLSAVCSSLRYSALTGEARLSRLEGVVTLGSVFMTLFNVAGSTTARAPRSPHAGRILFRAR